MAISRNYLLEKYAHVFHECSRHIVGNDPLQIASDLANDSFIKAHCKLHLFKGPDEDFIKWVYRIVKNTYLDYCRKTSMQQTFSSSDNIEMLNSIADDEMNDSIISDSQLYICIEKLPSRQAELIQLKHLQGLKSDEVSAITGIPLKNVPEYCKRARYALKNQILSVSAAA